MNQFEKFPGSSGKPKEVEGKEVNPKQEQFLKHLERRISEMLEKGEISFKRAYEKRNKAERIKLFGTPGATARKFAEADADNEDRLIEILNGDMYD